ncbi:MAG: GNAT family N-acetyltransferase, partial [Terracidiphilus sp.]
MNAPAGVVQIRLMTASDLPRVIEIAQTLKEVPRWPLEAWLTALDPAASPRRIALVADHPPTGVIDGFAVAALLPPLAELETIAVAAEARRQGVGSCLIAALLGELRQSEISEVSLEVRASNHPAHAFYPALGIAKTGCRARYHADPIEAALLMT